MPMRPMLSPPRFTILYFRKDGIDGDSRFDRIIVELSLGSTLFRNFW